MEWLGRSNIDFTHAPTTRTIKSRGTSQVATDSSQKSLDETHQDVDLLTIVKNATPPCQLNPLLFNGHVQTMWTATKPHGPSVYYRRRIFTADLKEYEGTFAVDFVVPPHEDEDDSISFPRTVNFTEEQWKAVDAGSNDEKPMMVVLHGLSGGSHEVYLRHCIQPFIEQGNWEICVINARGCAGTKITSGVLYNARATWDVRQVVKWVRKTFPNRPVFGLGFSLGANMLTNYCGEEGPNCELKAAVVCSNPFNLEISSKILQNTWIGKEVYLRVMGGSMRALAQNHKDDLAKNTGLDMEKLVSVKYLHEFDELVQCPSWGYPTVYSYYRDASSTDAVLSIRIPFLAVHAVDDPIAVKEAIPYEEFRQNPDTILLTTSMGGHLCWFESGGSRWYTKPVYNFLNHMAFETDLEGVQPSKDPDTTGNNDRGTRYVPMRRNLFMKHEAA